MLIILQPRVLWIVVEASVLFGPSNRKPVQERTSPLDVSSSATLILSKGSFARGRCRRGRSEIPHFCSKLQSFALERRKKRMTKKQRKTKKNQDDPCDSNKQQIKPRDSVHTTKAKKDSLSQRIARTAPNNFLNSFQGDYQIFSQCNNLESLNGGLANGGLRYLSTIVHDCLRLSSFRDEKFPLERGPKGPQKCTIVDDCAQIAESGLKPQFAKPPFRLSLKQGFWTRISHQKVHPNVWQNLCHTVSLWYLFCPKLKKSRFRLF